MVFKFLTDIMYGVENTNTIDLSPSSSTNCACIEYIRFNNDSKYNGHDEVKIELVKNINACKHFISHEYFYNQKCEFLTFYNNIAQFLEKNITDQGFEPSHPSSKVDAEEFKKLQTALRNQLQEVIVFLKDQYALKMIDGNNKTPENTVYAASELERDVYNYSKMRDVSNPHEDSLYIFVTQTLKYIFNELGYSDFVNDLLNTIYIGFYEALTDDEIIIYTIWDATMGLYSTLLNFYEKIHEYHLQDLKASITSKKSFSDFLGRNIALCWEYEVIKHQWFCQINNKADMSLSIPLFLNESNKMDFDFIAGIISAEKNYETHTYMKSTMEKKYKFQIFNLDSNYESLDIFASLVVPESSNGVAAVFLDSQVNSNGLTSLHYWIVTEITGNFFTLDDLQILSNYNADPIDFLNFVLEILVAANRTGIILSGNKASFLIYKDSFKTTFKLINLGDFNISKNNSCDNYYYFLNVVDAIIKVVDEYTSLSKLLIKLRSRITQNENISYGKCIYNIQKYFDEIFN